jgi:hypothetical protein
MIRQDDNPLQGVDDQEQRKVVLHTLGAFRNVTCVYLTAVAKLKTN